MAAGWMSPCAVRSRYPSCSSVATMRNTVGIDSPVAALISLSRSECTFSPKSRRTFRPLARDPMMYLPVSSDTIYDVNRVVSSPMPSMVLTSTSLGWMNRFGVRALPTPDGVPVKMRSPGYSVMIAERRSIRMGTV